MIAAVLLIAALAVDGPRATITAQPLTVEVGEPVQLDIEVEHASGERVTLDADAVAGAWLLLEASGTATLPTGDGRAVTTARWTVCALEPLEGALPEVRASIAGAAAEPLAVDGSGVNVVGVLAPGEDEPRGPKGFRDATAPAAGATWWPWAAGALAALAAGAWLARRGGAGAAPAAAPPTPLDRLLAIDPSKLDEPEAIQEAYYEITSALRCGVDARLGRVRTALTDGEWLADSENELEDHELDLIADVLHDSEQVKYGTVRPTHWGVKEVLDRARSALDPRAAAALIEASEEVP